MLCIRINVTLFTSKIRFKFLSDNADGSKFWFVSLLTWVRISSRIRFVKEDFLAQTLVHKKTKKVLVTLHVTTCRISYITAYYQPERLLLTGRAWADNKRSG